MFCTAKNNKPLKSLAVGLCLENIVQSWEGTAVGCLLTNDSSELSSSFFWQDRFLIYAFPCHVWESRRKTLSKAISICFIISSIIPEKDTGERGLFVLVWMPSLIRTVSSKAFCISLATGWTLHSSVDVKILWVFTQIIETLFSVICAAQCEICFLWPFSATEVFS